MDRTTTNTSSKVGFMVILHDFDSIVQMTTYTIYVDNNFTNNYRHAAIQRIPFPSSLNTLQTEQHSYME